MAATLGFMVAACGGIGIACYKLLEGPKRRKFVELERIQNGLVSRTDQNCSTPQHTNCETKTPRSVLFSDFDFSETQELDQTPIFANDDYPHKGIERRDNIEADGSVDKFLMSAFSISNESDEDEEMLDLTKPAEDNKTEDNGTKPFQNPYSASIKEKNDDDFEEIDLESINPIPKISFKSIPPHHSRRPQFIEGIYNAKC